MTRRAPGLARAKVPKHIAEAVERAWPDGVVEMIDLDEAPFWDTYPALKARLSRISGSDLVYECEPQGGMRWGEGSDPVPRESPSPCVTPSSSRPCRAGRFSKRRPARDSTLRSFRRKPPPPRPDSKIAGPRGRYAQHLPTAGGIPAGTPTCL
jgi:hypothetical protein